MRKHKADKIIALLVIILMLASLVIVYAIGGRVAIANNAANGKNFSETYFFTHHIAIITASIVAMLIGYKISYKFLAKIAKKLFWFSVILCLMVTIFGRLNAPFVTCDLGACRAFWVPIVNAGFQPVELLKICAALYGAYLIRSRKKEGQLESKEFWVPYATIFAVTAVIIGGFHKDLGSTVVISMILASMALVGGVPAKRLFMAGGVLLAAVAVLILVAPHRLARITGWEGDGDSYHLNSSIITFGTGGLTGLGLGNSIQASGYLPESLTDSIFSIIGETWGFIGTTIIIIIFATLLARILRVSERTEDEEQSLFAVSVFAWIISHVIINVGGMLGIIPMKGITLPFLSYGGTGMLFAAFAVGIVIQISGWTKRKEINEDSSSRRGQRRSRYSNSSRRS
ncbi:MAG: FtsW/RodA/SpoVE family cell cycle protein [Candidatus Saccharibacteria bacterium]|nr:FtsW/RodA/SpoVE family cell cycle protein [Candidatus Saccharibacteria bacterium]